MKFTETTTLCKGFALCIGYVTEDDSVSINVEHLKRDGNFSQIGYCEIGGATLYDLSGNKIMECNSDTFYDMRDLYHKGGYQYKTNLGTGGSWFGINPIPSIKIYDAVLLREGDTDSILGDGIERTIICVKGTVKVNDKTLQPKQYSRILKDKMATYTLSKDSIAIYFWDSGKRQG